MKKLLYIAVVLVCFVAPLARAEERARENDDELAAAANDVSGNKISSYGAIELHPQASIIVPWTMTLKNDFGEVPYANDIAGGIPSFSIGLGMRYATVGQFQLYTQAKLGYGQKDGVFAVKTPMGVSNQKIELRWFPVSASMRVLYNIPGASFVNPTLTGGVGTFWIHQRSALSQLNQNFLVPYAFLSPGISLFEGRNAHDWFGGVNFGMSLYRSFASQQAISGHSFDMSLILLL